MTPDSGTTTYRYRLRDLFLWTVVVAIFAICVRWTIHHPMIGLFIVTVYGSVLATTLLRQAARSTNIFINGLAGGSIGGAIATWVAGVSSGFFWNKEALLQMKVFDLLFSTTSVALFGGMLGCLFGVLYAFVLEEVVRTWRIVSKRWEA